MLHKIYSIIWIKCSHCWIKIANNDIITYFDHYYMPKPLIWIKLPFYSWMTQWWFLVTGATQKKKGSKIFFQNAESMGFLKGILPDIHSLFGFLLCCWNLSAPLSLSLSLLPARRGSGSRFLSGGPVRMSPPAEGWRVCPCGGRWLSKRTRRRRPRSTSAPGCSGTWRPYPEARGTRGPPTTAAAWRWAHWSSPGEVMTTFRFN